MKAPISPSPESRSSASAACSLCVASEHSGTEKVLNAYFTSLIKLSAVIQTQHILYTHLNFNLLLHFFVLDGGVFLLKSEEK